MNVDSSTLFYFVKQKIENREISLYTDFNDLEESFF